MSTTPPATTEPTSPTAPGGAPEPVLGPVSPFTPTAETAPSVIVTEGPTAARVVGFVGLFLAVLGLVVVVTTRATGQARWVPEWMGLMFGAFGLALMLYHALTDTEQEVRRMYGMLAGILFLVALAFGLLPGPFESAGAPKQMGYYLMPWGLAAGLLALLFVVPFTRNETDETLRELVLYGLLLVGGALSIGVVAAGILGKSDFLAGPGVALALLGVGFICAYLSQTDSSEGLGYAVALTLGAVGAGVLFYVFARTVFPTVLFEGPGVLRKPNGALDYWRVAGRGLIVLAGLGLVAWGALGRFPTWMRAALAAAGLSVAAVFIVASTGTYLSMAPRLFLVPDGLILAFLGLVFLAVGLGVCSDSQFVTLTRRELSSYFFSPIGYLVLGGMVMCQWLGYWQFYEVLSDVGRRQAALPEPIVRFYLFDLIPILCVILPVPALTMRLLSEEKRTGSLEVLLTSPVNEWPVVLSKFLATWIFFLICWLPAGLFLISVRMEAGAPFDYRPLLSFYAALAACSAAFISCGIFFSALTSNQIIAAVLTFMTLLFLVVCYFVKNQMTGIGATAQAFLTRLSFIDLWRESLRGQLPIRDVLVWASAAIFGLFLSVKALEARKWK
jgi:ABC-type transport system involved in multi-copper enzyme maturation permease subunit